MLLFGSLLVALAVTAFLISKVTIMLHAKRPEMPWVFAASLTGAISSVVILMALNMFIPDLDPIIMMMFLSMVAFFVTTLSFKFINQMNWGAAITTNIANTVLTLVTVVAAVVLSGGSLKETAVLASATLQNSTELADIGLDAETIGQDGENDAILKFDDVSDADEENDELSVSELDFLSAKAVQAIKAKEKKSYVEPMFQSIHTREARSVIGYTIRILNTHGNFTTGILADVSENQLVVVKRVSAGEAITPISISSVQKLEVYR